MSTFFPVPFDSRTPFQCTDPASTPTASSSSCATPCSRKSPVCTPHTCMYVRDPRLASAVTHPLACPPFPVKPSPSKKSRGGGQGGLRRAPTLGGPTPLSHATGQPGVDSKLVYHSHFKSTESEAEGGKTSWPHWRFSDSSLVVSAVPSPACVCLQSLRAIMFLLFVPVFRRAVRQAGSGSKDPSPSRKPC